MARRLANLMSDLSIEKVDCQPYETYCKEHYLQTDFWADFKSMHGWKKMLFRVTYGSECFYLSILVRRFAKIFHLAYVPMGPWNSCMEDDEKLLEIINLISKELKKHLPKNTICIRFDPPIEFNSPEERDLFVKKNLCGNKKFKPMKKNAVDIQPPDTTILDLTKTEEELLLGMKNKWRYNIHLAEKKGVEVIRSTSQNIDTFYSLYLETSKRDGIAIHSKQYYKDLLELSENSTLNTTPLVRLYIARHENDNLAAIITLFTPYQATYVYGASSNVKRNLMPAYLLQWTAIKDAKDFGSKTYDFYGMPPTDDENHPMHGLYRFKTGFGGQNKHRIGSVDVAVSSIYPLYKTAEKIRSFWYKKIKKVMAGR